MSAVDLFSRTTKISTNIQPKYQAKYTETLKKYPKTFLLDVIAIQSYRDLRSQTSYILVITLIIDFLSFVLLCKFINNVNRLLFIQLYDFN